MQRSPEEQALHRSREAAEAHKEVLLQASKAAEQLVVRMDKVRQLLHRPSLSAEEETKGEHGVVEGTGEH